MDPDECLRLLLAALDEDDEEDAEEHAENLEEWLCRGGFEPALFENAPATKTLFWRLVCMRHRNREAQKQLATVTAERDRYTNRMLLLEGRIEKSIRDLKGRT